MAPCSTTKATAETYPAQVVGDQKCGCRLALHEVINVNGQVPATRASSTDFDRFLLHIALPLTHSIDAMAPSTRRRRILRPTVSKVQVDVRAGKHRVTAGRRNLARGRSSEATLAPRTGRVGRESLCDTAGEEVHCSEEKLLIQRGGGNKEGSAAGLIAEASATQTGLGVG